MLLMVSLMQKNLENQNYTQEQTDLFLLTTVNISQIQYLEE